MHTIFNKNPAQMSGVFRKYRNSNNNFLNIDGFCFEGDSNSHTKQAYLPCMI